MGQKRKKKTVKLSRASRMASVDPWEDRDVDDHVQKLRRRVRELLGDLDDVLKEGDERADYAKSKFRELLALAEDKAGEIGELRKSREVQRGPESAEDSFGKSTMFNSNDTLRIDSSGTNLWTSLRRKLRLQRGLSISRRLDQLDPNLVENNKEDTLLKDELVAYRNNDGDTLAHTVVTYHSRPDFLKKLIKLCPQLLNKEREKDFNGQTPLHVAIVRENFDMTEAIVQFLSANFRRVYSELREAKSKSKSLVETDDDTKRRSIQSLRSQLMLFSKPLRMSANGVGFEGTVMLGQLPLSVAALTLNKSIVNLLVHHGAKINWENANGENVLHSLVRYASLKTHNWEQIWEMMEHITGNGKINLEQKKQLWLHKMNRERLTPMKMAVAFGLDGLFQKILKMEGIYHSANNHDGLFGINLYDITEIDTVAQAEWERYNNERSQWTSEKETAERQEKVDLEHARHLHELHHRSPSVLELICQLSHKQAFPFLELGVLQEVICLKWNHYKKIFIIWLILHLVIMTHITTLVIYKAKVVSCRNHFYSTQLENNPGNENETSRCRKADQTEDTFVKASEPFMIFYALLYLFFEMLRIIHFKVKYHLTKIHHNGCYRLILIVFSLALIIDTIWFYSSPQNNYLLILALISGWNFTIFFFKAFKGFSFYCFLYLKIISGDLLRLSILIAIQMMGFSIALYITYKNSEEVATDFEDPINTAVTMFKVMLGLSELEFLYKAQEKWLAISLYLTFVLICSVVLFNSLIAMMSRTCSLMSHKRHQMWHLQRLSAMLLLETMVLPCCRYRQLVKREELEGYGLDIDLSRCYLEVIETCTTERIPVDSQRNDTTLHLDTWTQTISQQDVDITHICPQSKPFKQEIGLVL